MSGDQQLSELIGQIYLAATEPGSANDLAPKIARAFDSESCLVYFSRSAPAGEAKMPTVAGILSGTDNFDEWARMAYATYYHDRNEWYGRAWTLGLPTVVLGQELIAAKDVLRTEWSDYLHATNTLHVLGTQFIVEGDLLGLIGIHRSPESAPFNGQDRQKMIQLMPHIQRALQLREHLALSEQQTNFSLDVLNGLDVGVVLLAADCRILFANRVAENALHDQCSPIVCNCRLRPLDSSEARKFELMVAEVAKTSAGLGTHSGGIFYLTLSSTAKLPVLVSPVKSETASFSSMKPAAIVVCSNPHASINIAEQMLARRFDLTRAEARLFSALISGQEIVDYAGHHKVSVGTVKTHLKSIFDKTGCHRQLDLVRIALSDPILRL